MQLTLLGVYSLNGKFRSLQDLESGVPEYKQFKNIFMALGLTCGTSNSYVFDVKKTSLCSCPHDDRQDTSSQTSLIITKVIIILFIYFSLFINFTSR